MVTQYAWSKYHAQSGKAKQITHKIIYTDTFG